LQTLPAIRRRKVRASLAARTGSLPRLGRVVSDSRIRIVKKRAGLMTVFKVTDWPSAYADWRVSSDGKRGRILVARGWLGLKREEDVGSLTLHYEKRKPPMIVDYELNRDLVEDDQAAVLRRLVSCAQAIALELGNGGGALDWQLERKKLPVIRRLFPAFAPVTEGRKIRRGCGCLRAKP
jgi:hypothetical protein